MSGSENIGCWSVFAGAGALTAVFLYSTYQPDRTIPANVIKDAQTSADLYQAEFKFGELRNIFQDRFGLSVDSASATDGVDGGKCNYTNYSPMVNLSGNYTASYDSHQTSKDQTLGINVKGELYAVTPLSVLNGLSQQLFGPSTAPVGCTINIVRYSDFSTPSPLGSQSFKVDARSFTGSFTPNQDTFLFDGHLKLKVHRAPWFRSTGYCAYTATVDGQVSESPVYEKTGWIVSDSGKAYRIDSSQTPSGFTTYSPCNLTVTEVDMLSVRSAYRPVSGGVSTPGENPKVQAIATRLANENPQLTITRDRIEEIELQPKKIIELYSDAVTTLRRSSSLNVEFEMQSSESTNANGGITVYFMSGSIGKTLGRSITATIKPGDEITAGVDLDGSKCRRWET